MVRLKFWIAGAPTPLSALNVRVKTPVAAFAAAFRLPVPFPLSVNVTPAGSGCGATLSVEGGKPSVVTVNAAGVPDTKVTALALVKAGAWSTVRVNIWVASGPLPLWAVNVIE